MERPTIAIVGPGRAGSTLARALTASGYYVAAIAGRHPDHARALAYEVTARPVSTPAAAAALAQLLILAVPDDSLSAIAGQLAAAEMDWEGKQVVHLSGAQDRS